MTIRVHALPQDGDLDNFITGICEGLMAAHSQTPSEPASWNNLPESIAPSQAIVYCDDSLVTRITAERIEPIQDRRYFEVDIIVL